MIPITICRSWCCLIERQPRNNVPLMFPNSYFKMCKYNLISVMQDVCQPHETFLPLEKLLVARVIQKFLAFYVCPLLFPQNPTAGPNMNSVHSLPLYLKFTLKLLSNYNQIFQVIVFLRFSVKIFYLYLFFHACHVSSLNHCPNTS